MRRKAVMSGPCLWRRKAQRLTPEPLRNRLQLSQLKRDIVSMEYKLEPRGELARRPLGRAYQRVTANVPRLGNDFCRRLLQPY
jgi:hypothetical protein